eukprot:symbB.v1.2.034318.t1/scaffold4410.1/size40038/2
MACLLHLSIQVATVTPLPENSPPTLPQRAFRWSRRLFGLHSRCLHYSLTICLGKDDGSQPSTRMQDAQGLY